MNQKTPNQKTTKTKPTIMQLVQKHGTTVDKSETWNPEKMLP